MDTALKQNKGMESVSGGTYDPFAVTPLNYSANLNEQADGANSIHNQSTSSFPANSTKTVNQQLDEESFLHNYEQRAETLLNRYYSSHPKTKKTITARMFSEAAREILSIYKDIDRIMPVEIPFAQLILEGGLSGAERTKGNVFNVGETDAGGHINKDGTEIAYIDGFKAYYRLIAKRYLDEKTPSQLLNKGAFTNGKETEGGSYAANTMYESLLKAEIGKIYIADSGFKLSGSVGNHGTNKPDDVLIVGKMLAQAGFLSTAEVSDVKKVGAALQRFQQEAILPDEKSDWHARRIAAIKGKNKSGLPDDSSDLSPAARQSMKDINIQKSWFKDGTIRPGDKTLGVLYYMSKIGNKVVHQGQQPISDGSTGSPSEPLAAAEGAARSEGLRGTALVGGLSGAVEDPAADLPRALGDVFDWLQDTPMPTSKEDAGVLAQAGAKAGLAKGGPQPDTLVVQRGELTMQGEGSDAQTRYIHWPHTASSGVTLGKGYDIGSRSAAQVQNELTAAGLPREQAEKVSKGAGLKGNDAAAFVAANKSAIGEIPREVQSRLLATMLEEYTEKARHTATDTTSDSGARNAAGREEKLGLSKGTLVLSTQQWQSLHPALVEFLTDLIYQGGYYGYDRVAKINLALKEHDGDTLAQLVAVRSLFVNDSDQESFMDRYADTIGESAGKKGSEETFYGKTVSLEGKYRRNQLRIAYLDHVIEALRSGKSVVVAGAGSSGQVGASHGSQVTEAGQPSGSARVPDAQKPLVPEPRAGRLTLLQNLNIRATPGIEGQKLGVLTKGTTVPFVTRVAGGWYQIDYNGAAAFLSGSSKYVHVQTDSKDDVSNTRKLSEKGKQDDKGGASTLQHLYCAIGHMVDEVTESFADLYAGDTDSLMRSNDTSLGMLLSQDRLTPDQIAQARQEIAKLPPAERARYYLQLQSKPEYQNQRDNSTPKEKASRGGTCNLTSVAMCLEYLGVANPYPTLQYDDALIKLAEEQGWTDLTEHRTWRMVAKKLGVDMEAIQSAGENAPRSFWESTVRDQHLSAGHSVLCSLNGHIVRVQEVTDSGLVVDDPYGASRLTASHYKFEKKNKGRDAGKEWNPTNKTNEGEDHAWSWPEIESHTFGIIYAFSR